MDDIGDRPPKKVRCIRCGRMTDHYSFIATETEFGYACADDRSCYSHKSRRMKKLEEIKARYAGGC